MQPLVLVIHGPNLNLLGRREPEQYGFATLDQVNQAMEKLASELKLTLEFIQTNHEGEIVDAIQKAKSTASAIIINPAAFTHTSIAVRDALLATAIPFVEVHLSNVNAREKFRRRSMIADIARGVISGFGAQSYLLGLRAVAAMLEDKQQI